MGRFAGCIQLLNAFIIVDLARMHYSSFFFELLSNPYKLLVRLLFDDGFEVSLFFLYCVFLSEILYVARLVSMYSWFVCNTIALS